MGTWDQPPFSTPPLINPQHQKTWDISEIREINKNITIHCELAAIQYVANVWTTLLETVSQGNPRHSLLETWLYSLLQIKQPC